jgi:hypothetical protein
MEEELRLAEAEQHAEEDRAMEEQLQLAEAVRKACIAEALRPMRMRG